MLIAAEELPRFFPMLMTAAGTIPPAQVLVLGAGVAGLQAIATARRLGAVVTAFDVRAAVKEQVQSLGAKFFEVEGIGRRRGRGRLRPRAHARRSRSSSARRSQVQIARSDVVITTALVPGRPAPKLITAEAVANMRHGSVIVDLAAEAGGNCELHAARRDHRHRQRRHDRRPLNLPSRMAEHASQLYARNVLSLLELMAGEDGRAAARLRGRGHRRRLHHARRRDRHEGAKNGGR